MPRTQELCRADSVPAIATTLVTATAATATAATMTAATMTAATMTAATTTAATKMAVPTTAVPTTAVPTTAVIRRAAKADLSAIVEGHVNSLPQFFLANPGPAFLRCLYSIVIHDPRGILLVSEQNGELAGFIAGFRDPIGLRAELSFDKPRLLTEAMACLLTRPFQFPRLLVDLCRVCQLKDQFDANQLCACELLAIAIQPRFRREGRGKSLAQALLEATGGNLMQVKVKVSSTDTWMRSFYSKLGFEPHRTFALPDSSSVNELVFPGRKS